MINIKQNIIYFKFLKKKIVFWYTVTCKLATTKNPNINKTCAKTKIPKNFPRKTESETKSNKKSIIFVEK